MDDLLYDTLVYILYRLNYNLLFDGCPLNWLHGTDVCRTVMLMSDVNIVLTYGG